MRLPLALVLPIASVLFVGAQQQSRRGVARVTAADSAIIARELAAWNALKDGDSTAFVRIAGNSSVWTLMSPEGIHRASTAAMAGEVIRTCRTRSNQLDSVYVEHPTNDVVILAYRVQLDRTCGPNAKPVPRVIYSMTTWVHRAGRWDIVAQSISPPEK
jgi:hypothetical protein